MKFKKGDVVVSLIDVVYLQKHRTYIVQSSDSRGYLVSMVGTDHDNIFVKETSLIPATKLHKLLAGLE